MKPALLYVIIDKKVSGTAELAQLAADAASGGADFIQYRDKDGTDAEFVQNARRIKDAVAGQARFIINDRVRLVLDADADGVHLGQNDCPLQDARATLGPEAVIGLTANTFAQAQKGWTEGADYIGMGAVFETSTKENPLGLDLDELARACALAPVPVFAIGGIGSENINILLERGITNVCLCSALVRATQGVRGATAGLRRVIDKAAGRKTR